MPSLEPRAPVQCDSSYNIRVYREMIKGCNMGLYRDNGKEHGNYYFGFRVHFFIWGYYGIHVE